MGQGRHRQEKFTGLPPAFLVLARRGAGGPEDSQVSDSLMKTATLLVALVLGLAGGGAAAQASPPPKDPKLVVAIAVDQYAWSLFQRYRPTYTGGLKRLADGQVFL